MTSVLPPFSEPSYRLPSCSLITLTENEAGPLSEQLPAMDPWLSLGYSASGLLRYMLRSDPALYRFVITIGPAMGGLVCVRYPWLRGPCLELIAVLDQYRGQGIGREVVSWIQMQCPLVAPNIWTLTSSFNTAARSFYRSLGFSEMVSLPNLISPDSDEILMRKKLK